MTVKNAFESVKPRGKDTPSATPRGRARSKAPMQGAIPPATKSMDSTGRFTVSVVSPPHFGIVGARPSPVRDDVAAATKSAHKAAQFERAEKNRRSGGRAVVKV